jgi:hypothetical protein
MNNKTNNNPTKIHELLLRLVEGDINDAGLDDLKEWFQHPDAMPTYWEFVKNYTAIKLYEESQIEGAVPIESAGDPLDMELWMALANDEKNAPQIEIPRCISKPVHLIEPLPKTQKTTKNISKFSFFL